MAARKRGLYDHQLRDLASTIQAYIAQKVARAKLALSPTDGTNQSTISITTGRGDVTFNVTREVALTMAEAEVNRLKAAITKAGIKVA